MESTDVLSVSIQFLLGFVANKDLIFRSVLWCRRHNLEMHETTLSNLATSDTTECKGHAAQEVSELAPHQNSRSKCKRPTRSRDSLW